MGLNRGVEPHRGSFLMHSRKGYSPTKDTWALPQYARRKARVARKPMPENHGCLFFRRRDTDSSSTSHESALARAMSLMGPRPSHVLEHASSMGKSHTFPVSSAVCRTPSILERAMTPSTTSGPCSGCLKNTLGLSGSRPMSPR